MSTLKRFDIKNYSKIYEFIIVNIKKNTSNQLYVSTRNNYGYNVYLFMVICSLYVILYVLVNKTKTCNYKTKKKK